MEWVSQTPLIGQVLGFDFVLIPTLPRPPEVQLSQSFFFRIKSAKLSNRNFFFLSAKFLWILVKPFSHFFTVSSVRLFNTYKVYMHPCATVSREFLSGFPPCDFFTSHLFFLPSYRWLVVGFFLSLLSTGVIYFLFFLLLVKD